jgi:hypothetical protein
MEVDQGPNWDCSANGGKNIAQNGRMSGDNELEGTGNGHSLIGALPQHFPRGTEHNTNKITQNNWYSGPGSPRAPPE